jgi:hypothetical protein
LWAGSVGWKRALLNHKARFVTALLQGFVPALPNLFGALAEYTRRAFWSVGLRLEYGVLAGLDQ